MTIENIAIKGLTSKQVLQSRERYGSNSFKTKKVYASFEALKSLLKEPMVILLLVASVIYFFSGNVDEGIFLAVAIVLVSTISLYQEHRSRNALDKLKIFSQTNCNVIRNGRTVDIKSEELVLGDYMIVEEGINISADAKIVQSNDFSVNESLLTGESLSVFKSSTVDDRFIYKGTTVASGLAIAVVTAIGNDTRLGEIGKSLEDIKEEKTPLERQINNFVKKMVAIGAIVFLIVWGINFYNSFQIWDSLLHALTLAMSILPEEIPVAFTTFMALGSYRLMKKGIIVKQIKTVETLGSATVICSDKTGTITQNKMALAKVYSLSAQKICSKDEFGIAEKDLIRLSMWASEPIPFDPMEIALHKSYEEITQLDERQHYKIIHEYPLGGKPPMMTHLFENKTGNRIIAAKGAPEALLEVSHLSDIELQKVNSAIDVLSGEGYRVLGVGESHFNGNNFPEHQQEFLFDFIGVIAFYDPPKENIKSVFENFYKAGIKVNIITGDNAATTTAIAKEIGFHGYENSISGDELMSLSEDELRERVKTCSIFTRMYPEAKLKIIKALKANHDIVAMTGDGVNDAPALKASHIGIAMGEKGTEIAKDAASLILLEDDLSGMVVAVAMGRRIYTNLKKAIQYIISIHIPIILIVFIPLILGWTYPNIFSPVHIIFLELIMGPTCSIIYENEPLEKDMMTQKPRPPSDAFFNQKELMTSITQGLLITLGALFIYRYAVSIELSENATRTMVFVTLISANLFLTLVNRSFRYSIFTTLTYKNNLLPAMILITVVLTALLLVVPAFNQFFNFEILKLSYILNAVSIGFLSVIWYELVKWYKRYQMK